MDMQGALGAADHNEAVAQCGAAGQRVVDTHPPQRLASDRIDRLQAAVMAGGDDLLRTGVREKPDVSALAALDGKRLAVMVWHYHDDDLRGPAAEVRIDLPGAPKGLPVITRHLVDETHSNAFTAWQAMGSPQQPTAGQLAELEQACRLATVEEAPRFIEEEDLSAVMVTLQRQGVTLLELEWK